MNAIDILILYTLAAIIAVAVLRVRAVVRGKGRDEDVDFTELARSIATEEKGRREIACGIPAQSDGESD